MGGVLMMVVITLCDPTACWQVEREWKGPPALCAMGLLHEAVKVKRNLPESVKVRRMECLRGRGV